MEKEKSKNQDIEVKCYIDDDEITCDELKEPIVYDEFTDPFGGY